LPVETPDIYLCERVQQPCGRKLQVFSPKKKGSSSSKPSTTNFFKEALSFRVSSEHGGGHGTTEEE
jgi:hypothetical protein